MHTLSDRLKTDHPAQAQRQKSLAGMLVITTVTLLKFSVGLADAYGEGIGSSQNSQIMPAFDIIHARISIRDNVAIFRTGVSDAAGKTRPEQTGQLAGSTVFSYVWPTTIDSHSVGFEHNAGILALAVTSHPDFDDTPLFDENGDGETNNDGNVWHSHWVVLQANERCADGALGVVDIPPGSRPRLPKTWPGLPILLDSPGWTPTFNDKTVEVRVPFDDIGVVQAAQYDGVTAGLRVNASVHAPLLCVVDVFDIASGDLSLPGEVSVINAE
ncbi:MAG: hypothetical protein AAF402_00510 [Pseudomonadota bacterium]